MKSDQEPATLKQAVRESMPTAEVVIEGSPVEEHQPNGTIEVTVLEIQMEIGVRGVRWKRDGCLRLVEHARMLMSRYPVGRDGRTAYEQHAGTACRRQLVEFGSMCSSCHFVLEVHDKQKLDPECHEGTFIGIRDRSDVECRKNEERARGGKSWNHGISSLTDTPWKPAPVEGDVAADALSADMAVPMPAPAPVLPVVVAAAPVGRAASKLYIKRAHVHK